MHTQELVHTLCRLWGHRRAGREEIRAFQNRKIRYIIGHACRNIRYYQQLFHRSGILPEEITTVNDLSRIPITEKTDLRAHPLTDLLARQLSPDRLTIRITSGSSGRPFVVRRSHMEDHVINMFRVRAGRYYGLRLRDRIACVAIVNVGTEKRDTFLTNLRQTVGIHYRYPVDCLQPAEAILKRLEELDPDIITSYPSTIAQVASLLHDRFPGKRLRHITCGGESLTPLKRKAIERGFGVPVFDIFGAHECNIVAWECRQTGLYHVCDDNIVAEVIKDGQPVKEGESGELVITTLHSYSMPFIRYRLGDVVVKGPDRCRCGQPFSTFLEIKGRVRDYFSLPDGRHVHPLEVVLPFIIDNAPWLDQFQMTQETASRFVLRVSVMRKPIASELLSLQESIRDRIGPGAEFEIRIVDHIPFEASGKFRDCRSFLHADESADTEESGLRR